MDKRKEIIKALENKTDEEVEAEFNDIIQMGLDDNQFWRYIREWKSVEVLIDEMKNWDINTKRVELEHLKGRFKLE
jgi:aryl carrier-like protein